MTREHPGVLSPSSRVKEFYAHPVGRDLVDKLLTATGRSRRWVTNPLVGNMRLSTVGFLARPLTGPGLIDALLRLANVEPDAPSSAPAASDEHRDAWWKQAVFYQVYPRSFADSDGDGVGDLGGVLEHLDHLSSLGVDCLWLNPIFASPNADNGYDISDYRAVDPRMGTLDQLDALIAGCHERGMRIILDLVVNHTSDQHPWFREAIADPTGPYGSYYYLVKPDADHPDDPPNNWESAFSGPAWRWFPEAGRWVLHLFSPGQPDLNWENPRVRDEVVDICRWWFDRGIDGFRMDVINFISKMPGLPDGHQFVGEMVQIAGVEHYFYGPRLHEYLRELRSRAFAAPDLDEPKVMVGEGPGIGMETGRLLTGADRGELDLVFSFDHLVSAGNSRFDDYRYDLDWYKQYLVEYASRLGPGDWMTLYVDNHDNPRMLSKINPDPQHRVALGKLLGTLLLTLRGTPFLYQGQEIAAVNQPFAAIDDLRDVDSLRRYQTLLDEGVDADAAWTQVLASSRDHARVPMRWDASPGGGFTTGTPWIVPAEKTPGFSVAEQEDDPDSVLNHIRALTSLRRSSEALRLGDIEFVHPELPHYFAWYRTHGDERWFIELNLSEEPLQAPDDVPLDPDAPSDDQAGAESGADPDAGPGDEPDAHPHPSPRTLAPYASRVTRVPATPAPDAASDDEVASVAAS